MSAKRINTQELTDILNLKQKTSSLNIIPYTWIADPDTDDVKCFVLAMQEITEFIKPIIAKTKLNENVGKCVATAIKQSTFNLIKIDPEMYESSIDIYVFPKVDDEGNEEEIFEIDNKKTPIVTVNLNIESMEELNDLIRQYVTSLKTKIRLQSVSAISVSNLIYMTSLDFYYLVRGTTYTIVDNEEEYEYNVANGMFFEKEIVDAYTPNRAEGEVPLTIMPTSSSNSPFQSIIFSKISSNFAMAAHEILSSDDEENAMFY